jgi:non-heme chloroperoxidase
VLIGSLAPYLRQADDNPQGVPSEVFEGLKQAVVADRYAFVDSLRDERLIADLTVVESRMAPHNVGWTHADEVNSALLSFLGTAVWDRPEALAAADQM